MALILRQVDFAEQVRAALACPDAMMLQHLTQIRENLMAAHLRVVGWLNADQPKANRQHLTTLLTVLHDQVSTADALVRAQTREKIESVWQTEVKIEARLNGQLVALCDGHCAPVGDVVEAVPRSLLVTTPESRVIRRKFFEAYATGRPLLLKGPLGCGKIEIIKDICWLLCKRLHLCGFSVGALEESPSNATLETLTAQAGQGDILLVELPAAATWATSVAISLAKIANGIGAMLVIVTDTSCVVNRDIIEFEAVTMLVDPPEISYIFDVALASEGFGDSRTLGKQLATFLHLAGKMCTQQPHYDFGLRFAKSMIHTAGVFVRQLDVPLGHGARSGLESTVLARTGRDMLWMRMANESDRAVVQALCIEYFGEFEQPSPIFRAPGYHGAAVRLHAALRVRHGAMLVNIAEHEILPCINAITRNASHSALVHRMPGTMAGATFDELYDSANLACEDGCFTKSLRHAVHTATSTNPVWLIVVCGELSQVDAAEKFKPLHSLCDDNKTFQTPSGEKIVLTPHVRIVCIAPPSGCAALSPATIARFGIVAAWNHTAVEAAAPSVQPRTPDIPRCTVKFVWRGDGPEECRRLCLDATLHAIDASACELFAKRTKCPTTKFRLSYRDEEGDWVTLGNSDDLAYAMSLLPRDKTKPLRIGVSSVLTPR